LQTATADVQAGFANMTLQFISGERVGGHMIDALATIDPETPWLRAHPASFH